MGERSDAPTYSLTGEDGGADQYYTDVAVFTDEVLEKLHEDQSISKFSQYIALRKLEVWDHNIYALELLMIGVLWNVYSSRATAGSVYMGKLLSSLYALRSRSQEARRVVDRLKGIAGTSVLARRRHVDERIQLHSFAKLLGWLRASGEFEQESRRLKVWLDFLRGLPEKESEGILQRAVRKAVWFERRSLECLGRYTSNVDTYIENNRQRLRWQENRIFCSRNRVEYHLNMVGAEIMNQVFYDGFHAAPGKIVFLPICMRNKTAGKCQAVQEGPGYVCRRCSKTCRVQEVTALAEVYSCKVLMIPHASTAFGQERIRVGEVGIIGVACVLNLISGGYKAREMGYLPQCVLLHYSGCVLHWHREGIETSIDMERLERSLREGQT
ncbi:hypothetical protein A3844_00165 [Paenibacillus helianthi]|uniref:DUF116 domain-containing protein n=1 Tax=Paenibacillus helianthi TaxID=1349432 RepID=A0ABX3ETW1_9BACL|nr:DUF116 domain-containing protein [Paenibacillus helianthi]OKP91584.1 hypothetical protein A3844_00165 [Paenibacillus helianthi]